MVARNHVLFDHSPFALSVVAIVGAATALYAATIGWCRTTSSECWPTRRFRSSGTCSWPAASRPTRRHLSPGHARLLQGAAVPGCGLGDSRHGRRAGPAQDGRPVEEAAGHLCRDHGGRSGHRRIFPVRRILLKRRHSLRGLSAGHERQDLVVRWPADGSVDVVLHVPPLVSGLPGQVPQSRSPSA